MVLANKYSNAFTEVYEILNYLNKEDYKKISLDLINTIKENRNQNYIYRVTKRNLKEQEMLPETKALLFNIFRDYLSTPEQKQKITNWQLEELKKLEQEKKKYYDVNVFKDRNIKDSTIKNDEMQLIEVKGQNLLQKIVNRIKKFLKR